MSYMPTPFTVSSLVKSLVTAAAGALAAGPEEEAAPVDSQYLSPTGAQYLSPLGAPLLRPTV